MIERLAAVLLCAALLLAGCTQSITSRRWEDVTYFSPLKRTFPATKTARPDTKSDVEMNAAGFIFVGTVSLNSYIRRPVDQVGWMMTEAAIAHGADAYVIQQLNADGKGETGSTNFTCTRFKRDDYGRMVCDGTPESSNTLGEEAIKVSTASLWRKAPEQAQRERAWWQLASALEVQDVARLKSLLAGGLDPNTLAEGRSPLIDMAMARKNPRMVEALVAGGVNLRARDETGRTVVHRATYQTTPEILLALAGTDNLEIPAGNGETPLMTAAAINLPASVDALLKAGANVNAKDSEGRTPLMSAIKGGNAATVKALLDRGATVNVADNSGMTPLMQAAHGYHPEVVKLLLDRGASVAATTPTGVTALMHAIGPGGGVEAVRMLLDRGADVDAVSKEAPRSPLCCTALEIAISRRDDPVASELRKRGAKEPERKVIKPIGPSVATFANRQRKAMISGSVNTDTPLILAAAGGKLDEVRRLLAKGDDPNVAKGGNFTPLIRAAEGGHTDIARLLLDKGAYVNHEMFTGSALIYAAVNKSWDAAALLLDRGADPDVPSVIQITPLMYAAKDGQVAIAQALIAKKATVNALDVNGDTALHFAARAGQAAVIPLLLNAGADTSIRNSAGRTAAEEAAFNKQASAERALAGTSR